MKNNIKFNLEEVESVGQFVYMGSLLSAGGCKKEVNWRVALTYGVFVGFEKVWSSNQCLHQISHPLYLCTFMYFCVLLYAYTAKGRGTKA